MSMITKPGSPRRREADASRRFYERYSTPALSGDDEVARCEVADRLFAGDSRRMAEVAGNSVALVVAGPPAFAGKDYEDEMGEGRIPAAYVDHLQALTEVFAECRRVLEPGGRIAVAVANMARRPYRSVAADMVRILQDDLGFLLRGEVVWQKADTPGGNCSWGSFGKASNPVLRDLTGRVIVASKGRMDRAIPPRRRRDLGLPHESSISHEEFMAATVDVWHLPAESARAVGHPDPFPVALARRLVQLYTYRRDVVLDPFMGSGTTAVACVESDRRYVGYDVDPAYVAQAEARLAAAAADRGRMAVVPLVAS